MNTVVICAAGNGTRLKQTIPKALVQISKKPMFLWALKTFGDHPAINNILILAPKAHIDEFHEHIKNHADARTQKKIIGILEGGHERQDSVYKGIAYLHQLGLDSDSTVLVHNAANIFVSAKEISDIIKNIEQGFASAIAIPSSDTLRELGEDLVPTRKLDREKIWRMQTPQGASLDILYQAYSKAKDEGFAATDDVELVERMSSPVKMTPGSPLNLKITYPEDLALAESVIAHRKLV